MPTVAKPLESHHLDFKAAVQIALTHFAELYPNLATNNLMLEEMEESKDGKFWLITLGYDARLVLGQHEKLFKSDIYRAYKIFKIDKTTGKVVSMKIRAVD